jgi:DNA polymerase-1
MFQQEENRLHRPTGKFACISIKFRGDEDTYQIYDTDQIAPALELLRDGLWVGHNLIYDLRQLRRWCKSDLLFPTETRPLWDTMLVERVLWSGYYNDFGLKDCMRRYFDVYMEKETREQFITMDYMTQEMKDYAALDVEDTLRVQEAQRNENRNLDVYWKIDVPMIWVALDMIPVKVDRANWGPMAARFVEMGKEIENELGLNVYSSQKVKEYLDRKGIKVESTGAEILEEYEGNEIIDKILLARRYRKAASTYGQNWLDQFAEEGDLVYGDWKVTGAETGRMSCSNPSLQNIPARKLPQYRELFISNNGVMFAPDVSQQEPRILAYLSHDQNLTTAVKQDESVHVYVARQIYNDPTIVKGDDIRYKDGKAISLGLGYGLTPKGVAKKTNRTLAEAEQLVMTYFKRFPDVENYIVHQKTKALRNEYIETVAGRRNWLNMHNYQWGNNAINAPIQGSAADFTKVWGAEIWRACKREGIPFPICLFVHDEIVMDVASEHFEDIKRINAAAINKAAEMFPGIPFTFEENYGTSWACHK